MQIGILGGQFNPPHLGHLFMAQQALDFTPIKQIWLTPCFKHTFDKNMIPVKHRTKMTKMITFGQIKYCGKEIKNQLSGETLILMDFLSQKYPQHQFSFILGSDNLKYFKKWGQWQKLVQKYIFWVVPRPTFDLDLKKLGLDNKKYQFKILKHPLLAKTNLSSTMIRSRIKKNLSIKYLVDQKVNLYIKKHHLYA